MTTVRLTVNLDATQANVYAMAGTTATPMGFPAAYQCAPPFGADIGGVAPVFFPIANNAALGFAEFDSWLTRVLHRRAALPVQRASVRVERVAVHLQRDLKLKVVHLYGYSSAFPHSFILLLSHSGIPLGSRGEAGFPSRS